MGVGVKEGWATWNVAIKVALQIRESWADVTALSAFWRDVRDFLSKTDQQSQVVLRQFYPCTIFEHLEETKTLIHKEKTHHGH